MKYFNLLFSFFLGFALMLAAAVYISPEAYLGKDEPVDPNAGLPHFLLSQADPDAPMCVSVSDIYTKSVKDDRVLYYVDANASLFAYDPKQPRCSLIIARDKDGYVHLTAPERTYKGLGLKPDACVDSRLTPITYVGYYKDKAAGV